MKSQQVIFKWFAISFLLVLFIGFAIVIPSVSAQEGAQVGASPFLIEGLSKTSIEPTSTPQATLTAIPTLPTATLPAPESGQASLTQEALPEQMTISSFGAGWSGASNVSNTVTDSHVAKIAIETNGNVHVVWYETGESNIPEIYYSYKDGVIWSTPINISNSPGFYSSKPELVVDTSGTAHIVWQEVDDDHADDFEIHYSKCNQAGCTSPFVLSNGDVCSQNIYDWKSLEPTIGISGNRLMVLWVSYEPGRNHIPYTSWLVSESPPASRTGCHPTLTSFSNVEVIGRASDIFHLVMDNLQYGSTYYSRFDGSVWSGDTYIGDGGGADIFVDGEDQVHIVWREPNGYPRYRSRASAGSWSPVETISDTLKSWNPTVAIDRDSLPRVLFDDYPYGKLYESSRQTGGWTEPNLIFDSDSPGRHPDLARDINGALHLVWQQWLDGNDEIFYSTDSGYDCSGTILSPVAQAVLDEVGEQEYCGNHFDEENGLIVLPPGEGAFQRFNELARGARYEIDFTNMIWDENGLDPGDSPTRIFLQGVKALSDSIEANPENYPPEGVRVRILVGFKKNPLDSLRLLPGQDYKQDQRVRIMEDMAALQIPPNGPKWQVEVALYRNGLELGTHSHAKMMIVDGKNVIANGYNMQYTYLNGGARRDMGLQVSGPIALRASQVFDRLWVGALRCDQFTAGECTQESRIWGPIEHNPAVWIPSIAGNDVVFSLFRDDTDKTSDDAIVAAINAANSNVNIMQNRFMTGFQSVAPYAGALLNALTKEGTQVNVKIIVTGELETPVNLKGICTLRYLLYDEDPSKLQYLEGRYSKFPVHTKALSIDNSFVIVGSQNFDRSAWGDDEFMYDLVEYNLAIDSPIGTNNAANQFDSYFTTEWDPFNTDPVKCKSDQYTLQSEIDGAIAGSAIYIPAGVYTETVTINKPLVLVGADANQTVFQLAGNEPAFRVTSSDVTIMNLKISGGAGYGIELIDSSPSSLENVHINQVVFENNVQGGILAQGLIPDSPMNYIIENSTFIRGADGITINMFEIQAETSSIRNNIFYGQSVAPVHILSTDDSRVEYSYNLFDECGGGVCATNWHLGNVSASSSAHDNLFDLDPLFASPEHGAYQLSAGSPAIDAGDPDLLHDFFYDGNNDGTVRIDIGAFEYAPVANAAPVVNAGVDQTVNLGDSVTVNATYTDIDNPEDHSARTDWDDGVAEYAPVSMTGPGAGEVIGQHTYADPGNYIVEVCVTDLYGGVGCDTINVQVLSTPTACTPSNSYGQSGSGYHLASLNSAPLLANFERLPLSFVPNRGQEDGAVKFNAKGLGGSLFFTPGEVVFSLPNPVKVKEREDEKEKIRYDLHPANVVRIHYQGANENPEVVGIRELPGVVNVLKGNNSSKWRTNLPTYSGIAYRELYPGVELRYEGTDGTLKSTFHVAPGADPAAIVWRYKGVDSLGTDESGNLVVNLPEPAGNGAVLIEQAPIAWQIVNDNQVMVAVQYAVEKNDKKVGFAFPNGYDPTLPLVIDPTITYSAYLGGGKTDQAYGITVDADCNLYVTGATSSSNFPTVNPFQTNPPTKDIFISKLNPAGDTLLYSTYLGGNESDQAAGILLDSQGRITIVGESESSDFPIQNGYASSLAAGTCGDGEPCDDVVVAQLSPDGAALRYSTYLGGGQEDDGLAIAIGPDDKIYITGATRSSAFPTVNAYDNTFGGGTCSGDPCNDVFVAAINPALTGTASLLYSTFLGGNNYDVGTGIAVDSAGHVYVSGYARSSGFPTLNAYQSNRAGSVDAFVTKLDPSLSGSASLLYSSYLGGTEDDRGFGLALHGTNQVYLTGYTRSPNFPRANPFDDLLAGTCGTNLCYDAFVSHLDIGSNTLAFSSFLGGSSDDKGAGITVDTNGNIYLTGHTKSTDFQTLAAIQPQKGADSCASPPCADAFVTKVSAAGTLTYSTYLGGSWEDYGNAVLVDGLGNTYIAGYTFSSDLPTPNTFPYVGGSGYSDAFVVKIGE